MTRSPRGAGGSTRARTLALITLGLVLAVSRAVEAGDEPDTEEGRAWFTRGSEAFSKGDHAAAADAFKRGFDAEPWSGFLFAWAQAERAGGSCPAAIELYARFIATDPPEQARQHAIGWIEVCGGKYDPSKPRREPTPDPIAPRPVDPVVTVPTLPSAARDDGPRFHHKLAVTLGVASVGAGLVALRFYTWSRRDADTSLVVTPYAETARVYERSLSRLTIARASAGLAAGFAVGAVVRFVLHRPAATDRTVDVAIAPDQRMLVVTGAF